MNGLGIALMVVIAVVIGSMAALQMKSFEDTLKIQGDGTWSYVAGKEGQTYVVGPNNQTYLIKPSSRPDKENGSASVQLEENLTRYNVSGYVFDSYGSGIGGVTVQNDSIQGITSASGYYSIPDLVNGTYNFTYSKAEFNTGYLEVTISGADNNNANITIYAIPPNPYIPPAPVNLTSTQGRFWVNHTWEAGAGNVTDSYNISVNGMWSNGTTSTYYNDSMDTRNWSNITVWAYNNSGSGGLSLTSVSQSIQVMSNISAQGSDGPVYNLDTGDSFSKIQDAINAASDGQTITVDAGTYNESVIVNKRLTIRSTSGNPEDTIVAAQGYDYVFEVTVPYVNISGFTAKGTPFGFSFGLKKIGIYLGSEAHHSNISNNKVKDNSHGIYLGSSNNNMLSSNTISKNINIGEQYGIYLGSSNNNILSGNIFSENINLGNQYGIYLESSNNNMLSDNIVSNNLGVSFFGPGSGSGVLLQNSNGNMLNNNLADSNSENGIYMKDSSNNVLMGNLMAGNKYNFRLDGSSGPDFDNDIDTSNSVDGKPIYYIKEAADKIYESSSNAGTFYCINCANITIKDLSLNKNGAGIFFWNTRSSRIQNVTVSDNAVGVHLGSSSSNEIYNNNFINNLMQAKDNGGSANVFDLTMETGGNYWNDYSGTDADGDGIGDTPYLRIGGGQDRYPYMQKNGWNHPRLLKIMINDGADYTDSPDVTLSLSAKNAIEMSFSSDSFNWTDWEPFNTSRSWTLTNGSGSKTVYFKTRNNISEALPVNDSIIFDPSRGAGGSSGGGGSGSSGSSGSYSSGSRSGGAGGWVSGEDPANIEVNEQCPLKILKDIITSCRFNHSRNPIIYVNITGNVDAGEINVIVEVLRKTSTLIKPPTPAPGIVYKNVNIWVGPPGFAVPANIKTAIVRFKTANSWLDGNKILASDVRLVKWDGRKWTILETQVKEKDSTYTYFEATTNSFSPFAISGLKGTSEAAQAKAPINSTSPETVRTYVLPVESATEKPKEISAFMIILAIAGIAAILAVYTLMKRR